MTTTPRGKAPNARRAMTSVSDGPVQLSSPLDDLSATARKILDAARRLVIRGGYDAVSMKAVADEAGELKSTVAYHFGDKAGLLSFLIESLIHDGNVHVMRSLGAIPSTPERVHALLEAQVQIAGEKEYWRVLFGLLPQIVKDQEMHARFGDLMRWYYEVDLRSLGLWDDERRDDLELTASLLLAVLEGFALQRELIPDGYDLEARFRLWESIITPHIERLLAERNARGASEPAPLEAPPTAT
jgi:AcrR family transcriptional regulator